LVLPGKKLSISMKNDSRSVRYNLAAQGLVLGFACLVCASASGQLLKNGNFEQPLGPTNWTVVYVQGGPDDFEIKDRTTVADRQSTQQQNTRGAHLRPCTFKDAHAYFSQTVTNLVAGHSYTVQGDLRWHRGDFNNASITYRVYFEAVGQSVARSSDVPDSESWSHYSLTQTPDASGKIEVRLHLDKFRGSTYDKLTFINGYFDNFSVTY
jgi:hypothetical protein